MKNSKKALLCTALAAVFVAAAACMPMFLFRLQDRSLYAGVQNRPENRRTLALDLGDVEQVKSLHQLYREDFNSDDYPVGDLDRLAAKELHTLAEKGVLSLGYVNGLRDSGAENSSPGLLFSMDLPPQIRADLPMAVFPKGDARDKLGAFVTVDPFTKKVIALQISDRDFGFLSVRDPAAILKLFISYLSLDVADDWEIGESLAASQKADLGLHCYLDEKGEGDAAVRTLSVFIKPL